MAWILNFSRLNVSQVFDEYKEHPGKELNEILRENKFILKKKKDEARSLAIEINTVKHAIDRNMADMKSKCAYFNEDLTQLEGQILDEDVYKTLLETKRKKKKYRELVDEHTLQTREISRCAQLVQDCRKRLLDEFRDWYEAVGGNVDELDTMDLEEPVRDLQSALSATTVTPLSDMHADMFYSARKSVMRRSMTAPTPGRKSVIAPPTSNAGNRRKHVL